MDISFTIPEDKTENFTPEAKKELSVQAVGLINDLVDEVCRVEAVRRDTGSKQEITQNDVKEGARFSRIRRNKKKKYWKIALQASIPILTSIVCLYFDASEPKTVTLALICFPIITALTFWSILDD